MTIQTHSAVETGHSDIVHDAQLDFYGNRLATCSSDRSVKIFDVKESRQVLVATLYGHDAPVWQVAWANPRFGSILATCSYDKKVIFWREEGPGDWIKLFESTVHESSVNSISFAPYHMGLMLACASSDGMISVVYYSDANQDWVTERIVDAHPLGSNAVSFDPNTITQMSMGIRRLVSGGCDNKVKIWTKNQNVDDGGQHLANDGWIEQNVLEGHTDWVRDVAWAPCVGPKANSFIASCSQDRSVIVWSARADAPNKWTANQLVIGPAESSLFDDVVWHVSWSLTGSMLAVSSGDSRVTVFRKNPDSTVRTGPKAWVCISDSKNSASSASEATDNSVR